MKESVIEAALVRFAASNRIYTAKFVSPANKGVPDRIFIKDGVVLFLEIKRPGKKPTPLQFYQIKCLTTHGANAQWCDSTESGEAILKKTFTL